MLHRALARPSTTIALPLVAVIVALLAAMPFAPFEAAPARAQEGIDVISDVPRNDFPTGVTFTLSFNAPSPPDEVRLRYELAPDGTGATAIATCQGTAPINCTYTVTSGRGIFVIPGAEITYNWEITGADGNRTSTPEQLYVHSDTRFSWQELSQDNVTVHFHSGLEDDAPAVLQAAVEALQQVGQLEQTTVTFPVKVFLYATAAEMQPAIVPGGGRGVTVLGEVVYSDTAMVSADTATLDITRHEVAHIVTREATKGPFDVPGWLNEGISVFSQDRPLPGHQSALEAAINTDRVLTMPELNSSSTGGSAGTVGVYYGQAGSIVSYLVQTYGGEKFATLLRTFKEGSRIDNAFETAYGFDQAGLENEWRASVGLPARAPQATATAEPEARADATPANSGSDDGGAVSSSDGDSGGGNAIAYAIIAVLGVVVLGTVVYSARVIRSRL
jgi:hypothetical protein